VFGPCARLRIESAAERHRRVPASENLPTVQPTTGDVVTQHVRPDIEILNTDAEGRLILCDTLTYVDASNVVVVDIATLTGAASWH